MNADHDFQIGKDHVVCEDYALSGVFGNLAYAVVCDGCSASPDVDFGARLLAVSARQLLLSDGFISYEPFGKAAARKANIALEQFSFAHPQCLDATLLAAWVTDKVLDTGKYDMRACLYGDGVFVHKKKTGEVHTIHIDFTNNAPSYPSYYLDADRQYRYVAADGKKHIVEESNVGVVESTVFPFQPVEVRAEVQEGDIIAVLSDGINSFRRSNNDSIPWKELLEEFTGYKNTNGVFARRRLAAFKRKCVVEGITHSDDISIGAIVV